MVLGNNDENLARLAQQGDRQAFLDLYNRYFQKVYNRVQGRVPASYAEDVTQDIFIAVVRSLPTYQQRSQFSTWLYTIVNRQIADFYRQYYRKAERHTVSLDLIENTISDDLSDSGDERALIQNALNRLPEHYQDLIMMRFADGLTFAEIAAQRGQSLEAVKSLYRRAIQAVREKIGVVEHD